MFEKSNIREHMEVCDATGRHVGTVDQVDGEQVMLTRTDSPDDRHHFIDMSEIDRLEDERLILRGNAETRAMNAAETVAVRNFHAEPSTPLTSKSGSDPNRPLFGTSGTGTGMGGSGAGEH